MRVYGQRNTGSGDGKAHLVVIPFVGGIHLRFDEVQARVLVLNRLRQPRASRKGRRAHFAHGSPSHRAAAGGVV